MSAPISLREKKLWIFPMTHGGAHALAAAWRALGVDAEVIPPSDGDTLALGAQHTAGDECLPQRITLGDLLKIARRPDYSPERRPRRVAPVDRRGRRDLLPAQRLQ